MGVWKTPQAFACEDHSCQYLSYYKLTRKCKRLLSHFKIIKVDLVYIYKLCYLKRKKKEIYTPSQPQTLQSTMMPRLQNTLVKECHKVCRSNQSVSDLT